MADQFSPKAPRSYTISGLVQVMISRRNSSSLNGALYISNNGDSPVYLGFTAPGDTVGNAKPNHGITVFPHTVCAFEDPTPNCCAIWAVCDANKTSVIGVQE